MRHIVKLLHRFRKDEDGAFALVFAVMAIVLIAMGGAAVDFTSIEQARTRTQAALDGAALALQPTIFNTGVTAATIQPLAQKLVTDQLADGATTWANCATNNNKAPCATVVTPVVDTVNGTLTLTANLQVQMNFVSLVGVTTMPSQIVSVATRKKLGLEVAMVLDNSGSMDYSIGYTSHINNTLPTRMGSLQSSATCAVTILFYSVQTCNDPGTGNPWLTSALPAPSTSVKFAVVPFNDEVNVGASNASASWIDRKGGAGTYNNDNFDDDDYTPTVYSGTPDRVALFSSIKDKNGNPLSWGGCVEARVNNGSTEQYDTDDTTPDPGSPDTMFTPLFAPDTPDSGGYSNNYISDKPAVCNWSGTCAYSKITTSTVVTYSNPTQSTVTMRTTYDQNNQNPSKPTQLSTSGPTSVTTIPAPTTSSAVSYSGTATASFGTQQTVTSTTAGGGGMCTCSGTFPSPGTQGTSTAGSSYQVTFSPPSVGQPVLSNNGKSGKNLRYYSDVTTTTTTATATPTATPSTGTISCGLTNYAPVGLSDRVLQERLCKYNGSQLSKSVSIGFGPNADCPANAITPLTNTPSTITTAINNMTPAGNTNIQEGAAWGFRVLSPTAPFTEGAAYNNATSKVMIVMTDGENTYSTKSDMNGASLYAAYAYPWDNYKDTNPKVSRGRMGDVGWSDGQFETAINTRLSTTCSNAKAAGITVYTIGLQTDKTSDPTGNTTLLTNCASPTGSDGIVHYFFPLNAADLQAAFVKIASQLSDLRIAK